MTQKEKAKVILDASFEGTITPETIERYNECVDASNRIYVNDENGLEDYFEDCYPWFIIKTMRRSTKIHYSETADHFIPMFDKDGESYLHSFHIESISPWLANYIAGCIEDDEDFAYIFNLNID